VTYTLADFYQPLPSPVSSFKNAIYIPVRRCITPYNLPSNLSRHIYIMPLYRNYTELVCRRCLYFILFLLLVSHLFIIIIICFFLKLCLFYLFSAVNFPKGAYLRSRDLYFLIFFKNIFTILLSRKRHGRVLATYRPNCN